MICRDAYNRVWVGGVESVNSAYTSTGLKKFWIDAGDLTTPAYEYPSEAGHYNNPVLRKGHYQDMFLNYHSKIPIIKEYMQFKGLSNDVPSERIGKEVRGPYHKTLKGETESFRIDMPIHLQLGDRKFMIVKNGNDIFIAEKSRGEIKNPRLIEENENFILGRNPKHHQGFDIDIIKDKKISSQHVQIIRRGSLIIIHDIGSTNGTEVRVH
jgi:hypothetical protein